MECVKIFILFTFILAGKGFRVNIKPASRTTSLKRFLMESNTDSFVLKKNGFVAFVSALCLVGNPLASHALPSGGRVGGSSSFHSSSSSRSSSSSSRSSSSRSSSSSSSRSYSSSPSRSYSSSSSTPSRSYSSSSTPSRSYSSSSSTPSRSYSSSPSTPSKSSSSSSSPPKSYSPSSSSSPPKSASPSAPSRSYSSSTYTSPPSSQRRYSATYSPPPRIYSSPPRIYTSPPPSVNVIVPVPVELSPPVVIISPSADATSTTKDADASTEKVKVITQSLEQRKPLLPLNIEFVVIAGSVFLVYNTLQNRVGGRDFSTSNDSSSSSSASYIGGVDGASVIKLTVGLNADWSKDRNIMQQLSNLATKYSAMADRRDFANLLSETSLVLLRTRGDWTASSYSGEQFNDQSISKAESSFQQLAIKERAKFEEENSNPDSSDDAKLNLIKPSNNRFDGQMPLPTQAVVSIVVALRGKSEAANIKTIRSSSDVIACLERLAADALTDEGENVMALEVLWSPSERGVAYTEKDLIMDYPDLVKL